MEICPDYISEYKSSCKKHYPLTIRNEKGWHYLAVNTISITNKNDLKKNNGDFYCLNFLHYFRTEEQFKCHEKECKSRNFCLMALPALKNHKLKFNI